MKILLIGSDGFLGSAVRRALEDAGHEVARGRWQKLDDGSHHVDLSDRATIAAALRATQPEAIINCAGIVANDDKAKLNPVMTSNLLEEAAATGLKLSKIVITGSAAEYGVLEASQIPVKESQPLMPTNMYGESKRDEEVQALALAKQHNLPVVVMRLFNPLGVGMGPRFLTSVLLKQIEEIRAGEREGIELGRLDAQRDYLDVADVATAVVSLAEKPLRFSVYNVGSGQSTSNGELAELLVHYSGLQTKPKFVETNPNPEPLVAIAADISRIKADLGWQPTVPLDETIKAIVTSSQS